MGGGYKPSKHSKPSGNPATMAIERTLSIIKPDVTERNLTGQIIARLEAAGFGVIAQKRIWWGKKDAKKFYKVHKGQPYYKDRIVFMTSGPIVCRCWKARMPSPE